jgi:hypothetical protein
MLNFKLLPHILYALLLLLSLLDGVGLGTREMFLTIFHSSCTDYTSRQHDTFPTLHDSVLEIRNPVPDLLLNAVA